MTDLSGSRIVSVFCFVAGVVTALLGATVLSGNAPETDEALLKYAELPPGEVRRLKATWERLADSPDDWTAVRSIHDAVNQDPQLDEQLTLFHAWWVRADPDQRTELRSTPDDEWADRVRQLMAESREPEGLTITFQGVRRAGGGSRSIGTEINEQQLNAFFQAALPDDQLTAAEQALLSGVAAEDRSLARALILTERLIPESSHPDAPPDTSTLEQVFEAIVTHLLPNATPRRDVLLERDLPAKALITMAALRSIADHFGPDFIRRTAQSTAELVDTFEQLDPTEQQRLMTADPATALSVLRARRARSSGNEANAALAGRLSRIREWSRDFRDRPPRRRGRDGNRPFDRRRAGDGEQGE